MGSPLTPSLSREGERGTSFDSLATGPVARTLGVWLILGTLACRSPEPSADTPAAAPAAPVAAEVQTPQPTPFVDVAADVGLDFVHTNGMHGELYYSEMMGGGVALFDYDRDGDLDVFLVDGHRLDPAPAADAPAGPIGRLYRNELVSQGSDGEAGPLAFTEVTAGSGVDVDGYGMGVVAFDYDQDGWTDLYVTQTGPNRLLRNRGDGTFEEVGEEAGVDLETWDVPAVVLDVDGDGWLDLFVGAYVDYGLATNKRCTDALGQANYCGPLAYLPLPDRLLRNRGDGTFEDIGRETGIDTAKGRCLGAVAADFNGDRRVDIYVANDGTANFLWIQQADGRFIDRALAAGVGVNGQGVPEASMGVAVGDVDGDGDGDVILGHLARETNTLFVNQGDGTFRDLSTRSRLGPASLPFTTFGVSWLDFDLDGHLDLLTANGAVKIIKSQALAGDPHPLHQRNQLFHNRGDGSFEEVGGGGGAWSLSEVSRGSAAGDLDNDGDSDVVIHNNGGPVRLLLNTQASGRSWLGVDALDGDRHVPGSRVSVELQDGRWLHRTLEIGTSYASSEDPRRLFGLGPEGQVQRVIVTWPDGVAEVWKAPDTDRYVTLHRGTGQSMDPSAPSED